MDKKSKRKSLGWAGCRAGGLGLSAAPPGAAGAVSGRGGKIRLNIQKCKSKGLGWAGRGAGDLRFQRHRQEALEQ